jgi:hypothetical protein
LFTNSIRDYPRLRSGEFVKNWRDKIQKGRDATSPYSTSQSRIEKYVIGERYVKYLIDGVRPGVHLKYVGIVSSPPVIAHLTTHSTTASENDALSKVIKKIKAGRSNLNGQSVLGELTKTLHGLRHPFQLMRDQTYAHLTQLNNRKRAMRGLPVQARKKAWRETISGTWLEYNFGMKPLIHDVRDIAEALGRFQFDEPVRTRYRSKSSQLDKRTLNGGNYSTDWWLSWLTVQQTRTETFCSYSVGYEQTVRPAGSPRRLAEVLGFTLENFVPSLYEVMPWSWLIDYFTNLGEIIEAGTFNSEGIKWISKSFGRKTEDYYLCLPNIAHEKSMFNSTNKTLLERGGTDHYGLIKQSMATYDRTQPGSLGVPSLEFTIPGRPTQYANLTAILGQLSGRTYDSELSGKLIAKYPNSRVRNRGVRSASDFLN